MGTSTTSLDNDDCKLCRLLPFSYFLFLGAVFVLKQWVFWHAAVPVNKMLS